ncbi:MAG: XTP/dITP diphosphatase [Candidatus Bathyarchaeia archaeon]
MKREVSYPKAIYLVSNNVDKFHEVKTVLNEFGLATVLLRIKDPEIQSDSIEEISKVSARSMARKLNLSVVTEDAGLFIDALKGFPGPYSSYVYRTIGNEGILNLMKGVSDRSAEFRSAVAFAEPGGETKVFRGVVRGRIATKVVRGREFGFDPIFMPEGFNGRVFAELSIEEKSKVSHRGLAFRSFAEWYINR